MTLSFDPLSAVNITALAAAPAVPRFRLFVRVRFGEVKESGKLVRRTCHVLEELGMWPGRKRGEGRSGAGSGCWKQKQMDGGCKVGVLISGFDLNLEGFYEGCIGIYRVLWFFDWDLLGGSTGLWMATLPLIQAIFLDLAPQVRSTSNISYSTWCENMSRVVTLIDL